LVRTADATLLQKLGTKPAPPLARRRARGRDAIARCHLSHQAPGQARQAAASLVPRSSTCPFVRFRRFPWKHFDQFNITSTI
jgi:hypothetical protein